MENEYDIKQFLLKETDIENVKKKLFITDTLLKGAMLDSYIYKFLIGLFNLDVDFEYCENPLVSIVIPVKDEFIITQFLLNSIKSYTQNILYEVIIADDNSTDETVDIQKHFPNIVVIKNDINSPGFLHNVNNAMKHARGKYILLLNNDMMVMENYLQEMLNVIEKYPDIGIVGAKDISIENTLEECGVKMKQDGSVEFLGYGEDTNYMDDKEYLDCDYCSGCSILFKKEIWDKLGGFDTNLAPAYYEDSDFAFRVKYNLGLKSVCAPKAKIYHYKSVSYSKTLTFNLTIEKNKEYFLKKWSKYLNEKQ